MGGAVSARGADEKYPLIREASRRRQRLPCRVFGAGEARHGIPHEILRFNVRVLQHQNNRSSVPHWA